MDWVELIRRRGVRDTHVLDAMRAVPRESFVPEHQRQLAYGDHPLSIGHGQTISQPYIVALMTELLSLQPGDRVLEVGTGSGYQAAVLAEMPDVTVYTVETIPDLAEEARERLGDLGYTNVHVHVGDGYRGWPEHAPYDAIVVTAAPEEVPPPLAEQLAVGGRLVIPLGRPHSYQVLWRFVKQADGSLEGEKHLGVAFVPFTRRTDGTDSPG
jgi:protein-L-isoaspartate(D-aspartate) O-methyltransferase